MNRQQYLHALRQELHFLPHDELEAAMAYYEEYFDDADGTDEQVMSELGTPAQVAKGFREEYYAQNGTSNEAVPAKVDRPENAPLPRKWSVWMIVLAVAGCILLSPVIFGAFSAIFGVICAVVFGAIGIFIGLFALGLALVVGGVVMFAMGLFSIFQPLNAALLCGLGLIALGGGILVLWATGTAVYYLFPAVIRGIVTLGRRLFGKGDASK